VIAKAKYLCDQYPALIHLKDKEGDTALHYACTGDISSFERVRTLCDTDSTVVRNKCINGNGYGSGYLPLHAFIETQFQKISELSNEGNCFRLFLRLYPAAAGIEGDDSHSPYNVAVLKNLSAYFLRLLLSSHSTIDPVERCNLNYIKRRQGMFLAFSALSSNAKPTTWAELRLKGRDLLEHVISYL
jgi:hypothetical protein